MPKPPLEDVGVEDDTVEVMEEMMEVMSVDDMSEVVIVYWFWVSKRVALKVIDVDGKEGVFAHYEFNL